MNKCITATEIQAQATFTVGNMQIFELSSEQVNHGERDQVVGQLHIGKQAR